LSLSLFCIAAANAHKWSHFNSSPSYFPCLQELLKDMSDAPALEFGLFATTLQPLDKASMRAENEAVLKVHFAAAF
jgi:hypothetical protein